MRPLADVCGMRHVHAGERALKAMLVFAGISAAIIIQERSTGRYFRSPAAGNIELVSSISDASVYETRKINGNPIILSIVHVRDFRQKGTAPKPSGNVLDYSGSSNPLITYPYHGLRNQQFSFILDKDGYYQIVQNGDKFLRYDPATQNLVGGEFVDGNNNGFLLWSNDGSTCYAGHKKKLGGSSFDLEESLHETGNTPLRKDFDSSLYGAVPALHDLQGMPHCLAFLPAGVCRALRTQQPRQGLGEDGASSAHATAS
ncbi:UNVERIFIED_CONTAM: hypothetical protein PYX00_011500 [Menopon gallinae]|uniref:Uncharacterized protein n=1 Tax=Menopon gallinae TaxID=328185 RepID=A0AAW2H7Y1_9NEOP